MTSKKIYSAFVIRYGWNLNFLGKFRKKNHLARIKTIRDTLLKLISEKGNEES